MTTPRWAAKEKRNDRPGGGAQKRGSGAGGGTSIDRPPTAEAEEGGGRATRRTGRGEGGDSSVSRLASGGGNESRDKAPSIADEYAANIYLTRNRLPVRMEPGLTRVWNFRKYLSISNSGLKMGNDISDK